MFCLQQLCLMPGRRWKTFPSAARLRRRRPGSRPCRRRSFSFCLDCTLRADRAYE